ncbi:MAG TPA: kelch repeat-containing protein, partial [Saprospiraceae bacterium]|nr:kelch repeat-containing protein [Saprospiraceae bacterium]
FFPVGDFCKYDPQTDGWTKMSFDSDAFTKRTGAVAFVVNGKAYVGSGRDVDDKELNDFWEYNPATLQWRKVADMPASAARYEAVAFTIGNYGYVGTGQFGATPLRDFWRFRPPADSTDPGEWMPVAPLPPEAAARYQAVAFAIDTFGYIATGYHPTAGYLNDVWRYDAAADKWTQKTPFQGVARTNALGFAISGYGYLGTGNTKVQLNGGLSSAERSLPDIWRYIPEQ